MFKRTITCLLLLCSAGWLRAQDLNARVQVLYTTIQNQDNRTFDALSAAMRDFLNSRKWSTDAFQSQERIDCSFVINITKFDGSNFQADAQIQSVRPVYGSTYNSTIFNISDKDFSFSYTEGQPLDYSEQAYIGNLTSLLAYYAYIIVGMDYDTFSRYSGTPYYVKAQNVVNNAQNASFLGWKAFENLKNRYWLAENLNNKIYNPIREALYEYHRNGLDLMAGNQSKGRKEALAAIPQLQKIDKQKQGSILSQVFFTAKSAELVNIASQGDAQDKIRAYNMLSALDPSNLVKYELLKK